MRVTIVAHDVGGVGGMERQLEELVTGLLARGVSVDLVSRTLRLPQHPALRWRRVRGPARPFVFAYPWFALVASLMLLGRRGDVLHVTGAIAFNRADVCTVHYVQNAHVTVRARRSSAAYRLNARLAGLLSRAAERWAYGRSSRTRVLVAVSQATARELVQAFPARAADIRVIENAVDRERFKPDTAARRLVRHRLKVGEDERLALFVGSEWRGKGLALAVTALAEAPDWQLCVVGSGDERAFAAHGARAGVRDRVHFVGRTQEPELYYAAADAFVLPSNGESFSLAALEAAASGLPVIGTDVGVVGELATLTGGAIIQCDSESIAAALTSLAERVPRTVQLPAGRFDWDETVEAYLALYDELRPAPRHEERELGAAA